MPDPATALRAFLRLAAPVPVVFERGARREADGVVREAISYPSLEGDAIPAFLFRPADREPLGGVVVLHQHAGAFHLGKSEVAGEVGDPYQAFGPALARRGLAVLAPDAITFEDRRAQTRGTEPHDGDWLQHYNALAYRLVDGDTLMRKVLDDAQRALGVLRDAAGLGDAALGVAGHSYGGLVALYHAAMDARVRFACVSGALCSLGTRRREGTGINMFEVVPGLAARADAADLLRAIAPRPSLIVSAAGDPYSRDADAVVAACDDPSIDQIRVDGEHALDAERFEGIVDWLVEQAAGS